MNVFILEDDPNRMRIFRRNLIGNKVVHTDNAGTAIAKLAYIKYDYIFLDHDLGGQVYVEENPEGNNGTKVVHNCDQWIINKNTCIIIHSLNHEAAVNMESYLKNKGFTNVSREPFTILSKGFKLN